MTLLQEDPNIDPYTNEDFTSFVLEIDADFQMVCTIKTSAINLLFIIQIVGALIIEVIIVIIIIMIIIINNFVFFTYIINFIYT